MLCTIEKPGKRPFPATIVPTNRAALSAAERSRASHGAPLSLGGSHQENLAARLFRGSSSTVLIWE